MEKKVDFRIIKTERKLRKALFDLLKEKDINSISVKEICQQAGCSRNAFYNHYPYKEKLYYAVIESVQDEIEAAMEIMDVDKAEITDEFISM